MRRLLALAIVALSLAGCARDYGVHGPYLYGDSRAAAARAAAAQAAENDGWIAKCEAPPRYCPPGDTAATTPDVTAEVTVTTPAAAPPKKSSSRSAWN